MSRYNLMKRLRTQIDANICFLFRPQLKLLILWRPVVQNEAYLKTVVNHQEGPAIFHNQKSE